MVELSRLHGDLFEMWQDSWLDLEAKLVDLSRVDGDEYVKMMCDEVVTLEKLEGAEWRLWEGVMKRVHESLKLRARVSEDTMDQGESAYKLDESSVALGVMRRIMSDWSRGYISD